MNSKRAKENLKLVKAMHTIVRSMNDESAYYNHWIYVMPDGATEEDFEYFSEDDEEMKSLCKCFRRIIKKYGDSGFVSGDFYDGKLEMEVY